MFITVFHLCFCVPSPLATEAWLLGQDAGVRELPGRFDDADVELMRYAGTAGLLRAPPGGRPAVAAKSARAVQATTEWLADHRFLTDGELQRWDHLVRWWSTSPGMLPDCWRPGCASRAAQRVNRQPEACMDNTATRVSGARGSTLS